MALYTFFPPIKFGYYNSQPRPFSWYGVSGFFSVPSGHSWSQMVDSTGQIWVSPNVLTRNADGTVSGSPLYAADLNCDGTLVYMDEYANRQSGIDSPPPTWLSQRAQ